MTGLIATRKSLEAQIARELREGEFYGLANDRIEWLLAERQRLVRLVERVEASSK